MSRNNQINIQTKSFAIENIEGTIIVFMYVFSFYIIGPINSSILIAGIALCALITNHTAWKWLIVCINSKYFMGMCTFVFTLITLCIIYSLAHQTYDFSYAKTLVAQLIHLICGAIVIAWIYSRLDVNVNKMIKWLIMAYLVQSLIELVASATPSLASVLLYFNHADDAQAGYNGVRGLALSSGTTWNLGLTYGIVFILYIRYYLMHKVNLLTVAGIMLLVVGTFFAGRTGFVGACIGFIYFILFSKKGLHKKAAVLFYAIFIIYLICQIAMIFFYDYVIYAISFVLPWALEPLLNLIDGKGLSSGSTDVLDQMWSRLPTLQETLLGTGYFIGRDGAYYMHTDVGVLRNIFYWGLGGYSLLIAYQIYTMLPILRCKSYRNMMIFVFIYLAFAEYKAMTIGYNKMVLSIIFLISFSQVLDNRCRKLVL
jgi:hypothetical protein